MRSKCRFAIGILLTAFATAAFQVSTNAAGDEKLVSFSLGQAGKSPVYWPSYAAQELGYFKDQRVDVEFVTIQTADCVRGMIGRSIEACTSDPAAVVLSQKTNPEVKIVATLCDPSVNTLNVAPSIKDWSDLKGKAIAVALGEGANSASGLAIQALLAAKYLYLDKDYTFLAVGASGARFAALKAGKVAAAITSAPASYDAAVQGYRIVGQSTDAKPIGNYTISMPGKNPATDEGIRRFVRAVSKASSWISDPANKEAAKKQLETLFKMSGENAGKFYEEWVAKNRCFATAVPSLARIQEQLDLINTFAKTRTLLTPEQLVDLNVSNSK